MQVGNQGWRGLWANVGDVASPVPPPRTPPPPTPPNPHGTPQLRYEVGERIALLTHYAWVGALLTYVCVTVSPAAAVALFATAQMLGGLLLAIAFGVGHNGMPTYDAAAKPGFAELAITTTRNVDDSPFVGWFMGGLHYQIEHHIFPTGAGWDGAPCWGVAAGTTGRVVLRVVWQRRSLVRGSQARVARRTHTSPVAPGQRPLRPRSAAPQPEGGARARGAHCAQARHPVPVRRAAAARIARAPRRGAPARGAASGARGATSLCPLSR